jgi:hypothetical protein
MGESLESLSGDIEANLDLNLFSALLVIDHRRK